MPIGHSTAGSLRVTVVEVGEEFRALAAIVNGLSSRSELKRKRGDLIAVVACTSAETVKMHAYGILQPKMKAYGIRV